MSTERHLNSKGFTLLELLVVISIIGLLATVIINSVNVARQKARDAERIKTVQEIRKAIELYFSDFGYYPPLLTTPANVGRTLGTVVCPGLGGATIIGDAGWCDLMTAIAPYYKHGAKDPLNTITGSYLYWYDADGTRPDYYSLMAVLENSASEALATNDGGMYCTGCTINLRGYELGNEPARCLAGNNGTSWGDWRTGGYLAGSGWRLCASGPYIQ